jgi:hypothetical protein
MSVQPSEAANAAMSSQISWCTIGVADDAALGVLSVALRNCGLISASRCIGAQPLATAPPEAQPSAR